ncbi:Separin [Galdieria sulphuraria]|nr:Separin [Galdieria sulphuraria]
MIIGSMTLCFIDGHFSYVSFHFQNAVFLQKVLQSFGNILKRSYYKVTVNEVVKTRIVRYIRCHQVMICLHEAIPDEAKLYDVLFPALEGIHLFISASSPSSSDLIKNVAKLFHNIAALLVQKRSSLLIASICMRRSIELREMIKGEKENQMSRFGLLCKIMLRLSEPCACASIILEMIYYADPSNSPSKMQIPSDILKALSCFVYWCENNESSLQEYFGISALEQLAIQGGPSAVEFAFLAFRLLQWKVNDHFTQLYHTWSCERNCVIVLQRHCNDPVTQYWLQLEILRFKFYEDLTLIDDPILPSKYDDRDESTSAQVECLQWIHLSWKLLVDLMMNNSNYSFQNSGILELWNNILQYSPQIIRPIILIHLFEILEWFCEIFLVTQNSQLLWTVAQMLCHFITVFRENCPIDTVRIREYLTFVSAVALKNYRLYENAQALLSYSCLDNSVGESVELLLLRFALDICSYEKSNEFEIPNLTDLYPSKSSHALYKFYHSQYLWKKGNLKGSYDKALEAVKLYLALLQQSSLQSPANCTTIEENEELKTLNVAGTHIKMKPSSTDVGFMNDLRQAAECLGWLGEICDKLGCVSEAEYYWQCCLDVFQRIQCVPRFFETTYYLMILYRKSLQIDKFKRSIESFQFLIQEIQQNLQDSVLQALSCFYLKRLSLMNEMVHLHLSSSTACCLEQLEECNEIRKDHTFWNLTDSGNNYIASSNSYKLCSIITRRFVDPHDQAICFYKHAKKDIFAISQSNGRVFDWKCTLSSSRQLDHDLMQRISGITHLIEQALQIVVYDPMPWLQKRLFLLMANMKHLGTSQYDDCLYFVQKACGLEYWYHYQVYQSNQEAQDYELSELSKAMQLKWQVSVNEANLSLDNIQHLLSSCSSCPLLESFPKEWTIVGLTPDINGNEMYLWLRPGNHQMRETPVLVKYPLKSLEDGKNTLECIKNCLERLIQASHDQASGKISENLTMEEKSLWWKERKELDDKFSEYMQELEDTLFGAWKIFLLSMHNSKEKHTNVAFDQLQEIIGNEWILDRQLFHIIFSRRIFLDRKEDWLYLLKYAIDYRHHSSSQQPKLLKQLEEYVDKWWMAGELGKTRSKSLGTKHYKQLNSDSTILLVLDDTLLPLPIESIPFKKKVETRRHQNKILFSKDQAKELVEKLSRHQLFVYCGHGTGEKFIPAKQIRKLERAPIALLMGCSSGKPSSQVVVNLWDVTDRDIDRFTHYLLEEWFTTSSNNNSAIDLALAILRARDQCYFTYLTGCAPVVYGLPWIRTTQ